MSAHKRRKRKKNTRKKVSSDKLRQKLKLKHLHTTNSFKEKYPDVDKLLKKKGIDPTKLREHSAKVLGSGILAGSLVFSTPTGTKALQTPTQIIEKLKEEEKSETLKISGEQFVEMLDSVLPEKPRPLERNEEKLLEQIFSQVLGVKTKANLEGEHLNTTYGFIGAEQHLRRYPGDTLDQHGKGDVIKEGIAPGLGAWGYFAPSKEKLSQELVETERWYAVVQTLYLPDWNQRQPHLKNWYKHRKVLIVNTINGKAVVASIADSGPAAWTGKHFGGSPEVMDYLGGPRYKKGEVVIFFVDDPENKVALGPVEYAK